MREDQVLPHLAAIAILLAGPAGKPGRGIRSLLQVTGPDGTAALIDRLRADGVVLTYDPDDRALRAAMRRLSPSAGTPLTSARAGTRKGGPPRETEGKSTRRARRLSAGDNRACP